MLNNMKIGARLMALVGLLSVLLIGVGLSGLRGMSSCSDSLETVYVDRVVPLRDLKVIADMYAVNIVDTSHKVRNGNVSWADARKNVAEAEATIAEKWKGYTATYLVDDEKRLVAEIEPMLKSTQNELDKLKDILKREDKEGIANFTINSLYPGIDPISGKFSELIEIQLKVAKYEYDSAVSRYQATRLWSVAAILLGLLFGFGFAVWIIRSVTRPMNMMQGVMSEVERTGDYSKKLDYQSEDEVGQTALAFNSMMRGLQNALSNTNAVMDAVAKGDFSQRVNVDARGDLAQLKQSVNASVDKLELTMSALTEVMKALREGNFDKRVDVKVEGEFKSTVDQAMQAMLGDVGQVMNSVAQGDLTQRVRAEGRGDLAMLKENINRSLEALGGAMRTINNNTRQVAAAANQSSTAIGQISDGAQNQMHAINQVATAVRQTATSVTDVSNNTEAASKKSQESVAIVRDGKAKMERMVEVVNSIATNSEKINKITEVIEKIANKTNLLSLNAAIEAARAGEHGKGFAVVAEEVGKLAANSAESTQEIAQLVQQAVSEANRAVETVKEVSLDMNRIEEGSMQSDAMLQRISAALEQQSAAVQEINANVANLNKIAESNAAASEEITATVVELSKIADNTRREVEKFSV